MDYTVKEVNQILETGIALSKEKNQNLLLDKILSASMEIANCDAGTLYTCKDGSLFFKVMKTLSQKIDQGGDGEEIDLPPVPMREENICAYTALHKELLNIDDVYQKSKFDFSGPYRYDKMTGYHTCSMMTIPLTNQDQEVIGVMQLINAMDERNHHLIPFAKRLEGILLSLASQAAITMTNISYVNAINNQMWSFTEAMAETIDARTPYNANHIRIVADYSCLLADYINEMHDKGLEEEYFTEERREQLRLSALLHDIGKVAIPTKIMNKATRLEQRIEEILLRFELFRTRYRVQFLEKKISKEQYEEALQRLQRSEDLAKKTNVSGFLSKELKEGLKEVIDYVYEGEEGIEPYFTEEEKECLMIEEGTLTEKERQIMESHVELTERILDKVHFNPQFEQAKIWASQHHEYLDGSGYPRHLNGKDLSLESRILTVADICDALIASDRPYRKSIPKEKAFCILRSMVKEGKLDGKLVDYLDAAMEKEQIDPYYMNS